MVSLYLYDARRTSYAHASRRPRYDGRALTRVAIALVRLGRDSCSTEWPSQHHATLAVSIKEAV